VQYCRLTIQGYVGRRHRQKSLNVSSPLTEEEAVLAGGQHANAGLANFETEADGDADSLKAKFK